MTSTTPVPKSDVEVPTGRQMSNRNSFRNSSMRRGDSFAGVDSVPADAAIIRRSEDEDDPRNSSLRLSAALAAEREETRIRLSKELEGEDSPPEDSDGGDGGDELGLPSQGETMTMSLMDLLEETDRQAGIEGPTYRFDDEEEDEVDDEEDEEEEEEEEKEEVKGGGGGGGEVACCLCKVKHKGTALVPCGHTYCRMCSREMWVQKGHCPVCSNFVSEILDIF